MPDLFSIAHISKSSSRHNDKPLAQAPPVALTREQTVDQIITVNPSATADFLAQFDDELLTKYLDHLRFTQQPRCGQTPWERPGDAPAIMVRKRVV